MVISRSWLALTLPLAIVALTGLVFTIRSLLRTVRRSVVASLPVQSEQALTFDTSGTYALNIEGRTFSRVDSSLSYSLSNASGATSVPLERILFRTRVSSFSRARLELFSFEIPTPGHYTLRTDGDGLSSNHQDTAIVITRRYTPALVLHVLALVVLGLALIGSIVVTGLALAGTQLSGTT